MDPSQISALETVTRALEAHDSRFEWTSTSDKEEFENVLGVFKINASTEDMKCQVDVRWPPPSIFIKDVKKKEKVWEDINALVLPALRKRVLNRESLKLTDAQLQQLLSMITNSNIQFELDHPDGFVIGVNKTVGVDVSLSTADISSMLAASWLFKSEGVRLARG